MNEKHLFLIVGILAIGFVGFMLLDSNSLSKQPSSAGKPAVEPAPATTGVVQQNFPQQAQQPGSGTGNAQPPPPSPSSEPQEVSVRATAYGYDKETLTVKAGQPVHFSFTADPGAGCGAQLIIDNVGVNLVSRNGETVSATFTPPTPGQYRFHCGMNMFRGVLIAT